MKKVEKTKNLELMNKILSKSELTEKDALKIGRKLNKKILKKHKYKSEYSIKYLEEDMKLLEKY